MKRKLILILACLLFLGGLVIMLLPTIRSEMLRQSEHVAVQLFEQYRNKAQALVSSQPAQRSQAETDPQALEAGRPFPELWDACQAYNEALHKEQKYTAYGMEQPALALSDYGWELETFATLSIPAAEIEAPVYLGTNRANLQRGAAVLGGSSLPTGGEGTHCVICGHRTWHGIIHPFIGLEQVQPGDRVTLTNPWEELTYQVISVEAAPADSTDRLLIQPNRDLLTVFTCTYPNDRRVLVTCERIKEGKTWNTILLPWVAMPSK